MQFKEAIDKFSDWRKFKVKRNTVRGYDRELRNLCLFLRNPEIENITIDNVMEYLNGMEEMGWAPNSFVGKCMAIRKFFEFYRLQGYAVINEELIPIRHKEITELPRVADKEQYEKLINSIPENTNDPRHIRNKAIITMLWDTGARNGEILSLNADDIDTTRRRAIIKTEKSKTRRPFREIFWTQTTNNNIENWVKKRKHLEKKIKFKDPDALFISICSGQYDTQGRRFTIKGVGEMLRRCSARADIPYMNAHSFRHHMGHHIIKSGGSSADVMNILGHSSVQSTTIYTMMEDKELEKRYRHFMDTDHEEKEKVPAFLTVSHSNLPQEKEEEKEKVPGFTTVNHSKLRQDRSD